MKASLELRGANELKKMFDALPKNVAEQALAPAVRAASAEVRKAVRASAPRSEGKRSKNSDRYGQLYKNINNKVLKKRQRNVRAAVVNTGDSFWGFFLEYGTRYIAAKPWFTPAVNESSQRAVDKMQLVLLSKIEQISLKLIARYGLK